MNIKVNGTKERIIKLEEQFRAPKEKVFKVWTTAEDLKKWFMAEDGVIVKRAEVDLEENGEYLLEVLPPKSEESTVIEGTFQEIDKPDYLKYTWIINFLHGVVTEVIVTFMDHESGSKIYLTHGIFEDAEAADMHAAGWEGCVKHLKSYLEHKG